MISASIFTNGTASHPAGMPFAGRHGRSRERSVTLKSLIARIEIVPAKVRRILRRLRAVICERISFTGVAFSAMITQREGHWM